MSTINIGNQLIYDAFGQALTGDMQGKAKQWILNPGVLEGMEVVKFSSTEVRINTGVFNISDGVRTVKVHIADQVVLPVTSPNTFIVARYGYLPSKLNFVEFLNVDVKLDNDVELGVVVFDGATIDVVSLSTRTQGRAVLADNVIINTGSSLKSLQELYNTGALVPGQQASVYLGFVNNLFIDPETSAEEVLIDNLLTGMAFPADATKHFYFILRTGAAVDINFKLRLTGDTASIGGIRFKLNYFHLNNGVTLTGIKSTINSASSASETVLMLGTAYTMVESTTSVLKIPDVANAVPDRLILCRLTRDFAHVEDTYPGKAIMLGIIPI